jgi:hypothetical protein
MPQKEKPATVLRYLGPMKGFSNRSGQILVTEPTENRQRLEQLAAHEKTRQREPGSLIRRESTPIARRVAKLVTESNRKPPAARSASGAGR